MLLKDLIVSSRAALSSVYPEEEARSIVARLAGELLGVESYTHIIAPETAVDDDLMQDFDSAMERIKNGEPLQYVLGYADFCGFRFRVTPDVLIPRPETEILCRETVETSSAMQAVRNEAFGCCASMKEMSRLRIMDLCTGSGCIAWTLALSLPGARVIGADISEKALSVAESQAYAPQKSETSMKSLSNTDLSCRTLADFAEERGSLVPQFVLHDVLSAPDILEGEGIPDGFDVIVSNPPYVRDSEKSLMHRNVLDFEPSLALFVPDDDPLKFYTAIAEFSKTRLIPGGFGMVEINEAFGDAVAAIFSSAGMSEVRTVKDFAAKNRFVCFRKS